MGFDIPNSTGVSSQNVFQRPCLELGKKDTSATTNPIETQDESIMPTNTEQTGIVAKREVPVVLEDGTVVSGTDCNSADVPVDKIVPDRGPFISDEAQDRYIQMTLPSGEVVYAKEEAGIVPGKSVYTYKNADGNFVTVEGFDPEDSFGGPQITYDA